KLFTVDRRIEDGDVQSRGLCEGMTKMESSKILSVCGCTLSPFRSSPLTCGSVRSSREKVRIITL
ncbi:MAG: hypothetical protein KA300_04365, partial [Bacteroidales bacterium]|nr:hypothetical protein [Bacteroidales bacterium]